jgi:hypothetical protein
MMRTRHARFAPRFLSFVVVALSPASALAQSAPSPSPSPAPAAPANAAPSPGTVYAPTPNGSTTFTYGPNTQSPNGTIGGGNATESSSHPVTGDQEDGFDYGKSNGTAGAAVHGDENGAIFLGGHPGGDVPYSHVVRRGDTLWGICGDAFENPYQWPRVWSYNPQIKNPHWIYPGDEIRLRDTSSTAPGADNATAKVALPYRQQTLVDRRRQVPPGTVFLRDQGWIHDNTDEVWGDVTGSDNEVMMLTDGNEIYLHLDKGHDVQLGQELTVFKPIKSGAAGTLVHILGTARIDAFSVQDRVARARIVESLDVIERGARVGPLQRKFTIVPPLRNDVEVEAHVLASIHPEVFWGAGQVVFIDKGDAAGLKPGNTLQIVRRGDAWRQTLLNSNAGWRVSPDDETAAPRIEQTPGSRKDEENYPERVTATLRVVWTRKDSAACLVINSVNEIEPYELAVAHKGQE